MVLVNMKLFTVGPVACYPEVLKTMGMQMMSHRSREYLKIHYETVEQLQQFLETENSVYLFSSTGTGFMEAAVRNCVKKVVKIETPLGEPVHPEMIEETIKANPDIEAIAITHNETSTGMINDLPKLTEVCTAYNKMVFVDAVSSMGGTEIKVDEWGIDICFSSSQKCFGVPPGLGIGSVSKRALKVSESMPDKGWYFDLRVWEKNHARGKGTPMTSVIPQIAGLNTALKLVEEMGGKYKYFDLYKKRNTAIREGVKKLGMHTYPVEGYESPTVSCIAAPEGRSGPEIYEAMRGKGFELAQGYGALKSTTFRIGNMGWIPDEYIVEMLEALGEVVA